jgi:plasmid maintenance system antidote protein VapI
MRQVDGTAIRVKMAEQGIRSVVELSRKCGITRNTLCNVINEKIRPSTEVMYKLADTLDMSPEEAGRIFMAQNLRGA